MTLPRVVVEVTPRLRGWTVRPAGSPAYDMDARDLGGRRVPFVSAGRRPRGGTHAPLYAGDEAALTSLLARLTDGRADGGRADDGQAGADDVEAYGQWLYECMLAPSWPGISSRADVRAAGGVEIALRWSADEQDLHALAWEAMHTGHAPLAGNPDLLVAITRVVPARVPPPVPAGSELRLLLAAGADLGDDMIREGALFMGLLRGLETVGPCTVNVAQSLTIGDLTRECARFRPHIVHLVANGDRHAVRLQSWASDGEAGIGALLPALTRGHRPMAVLLSVCQADGSCDSAATVPLAAELVTGGIAIVVAVTGEISEPACRLYTRLLINAVSEGTPVAEAAARGRRAALMSAAPPEGLDWARPALFVADSVRPGFQLVDLPPRRRVTALAQALELWRKPLFVGRSEVLATADLLLTGAHSPGFLGIVRDGSIEQLGGTRLLQEIAGRLLARGHIPLLLGPYPGFGAPASARELASGILDAAAFFAYALGLEPEASQVSEGSELESLRGDLDRLAAAAGATGEPFGPHSRPVILGDAAHTWAGALEPLLARPDSNGLGRPSAPIPVVLTASLREGVGPRLKDFIEVNVARSAVRICPLEPMSPAEFATSSQWLLLHPAQQGEPAYAPARDARPEDLRMAFSLLEGLPGKLRTDLYLLARVLRNQGALVSMDDDALLASAGRSR